MTGNRIVASAAIALAVAAIVIAAVGGFSGTALILAGAMFVGALALARVAIRGAGAATFKPITALLAEFLACVNAGEYEAAHKWVRGAFKSEDILPGEFPDEFVSYDIGRIQITRNLSGGSPVSKVAKVAVRLRASSGDTADYLFLLMQEGRTWTVDQSIADGDFDMVEYSP